jgi:hypothetical protein
VRLRRQHDGNADQRTTAAVTHATADADTAASAHFASNANPVQA